MILGVCAAGLILIHLTSLRPEKTGGGTVARTPAAPAISSLQMPAALPSEKIADRPVELIQGGEPQEVLWNSRTPAARRARQISLNPAWMQSDAMLHVGDRIALKLFDDAVFTAEVMRVTAYPNGAVGLTAKLQDGARGTVYLSYSDGMLSASLEVIGGADFAIVWRDGKQYALEVDRAASDLLKDAPAMVPPSARTAASAPAVFDPGEPVALADTLGDQATNAVVVNVMIVYSQAAQSWAAGNGGINSVIASAMERANEAHGNSDTRVVLNLVHSEQVTYTESGSVSTDLTRLRQTSDGFMDGVHALRDQYGADLICLLLDIDDTGGLGYTLTTETGDREYGFCLARVQQTSWSYTVVHEWGHNMGCSHSKTQVDSPWEPEDLYSYSAGWQWDDTLAQSTWPYTQRGYCTIMTYEDFDAVSGQDYERVPYFSNPSINYIGASTNATGNAADGDNARTIRNTRYAIADYRIDPLPVTQFPYSNSFEYGFIDWAYDGGTSLWERETGDDQNLKTAVSGGYSGTTNAADGDVFLFVDAAFNENTSAYLDATFDLTTLSAASISFSYYMYAKNSNSMGSLSLLVSTNSGSSWSSLWTRSHSQGLGWKQAVVNLDAYAGLSNVQLRVRANIGSPWYYNYLALDAIALTGTVLADVDQDGLPNDWEQQYFGGITNAVADVDSDGDGFSNLQEYISGFNPTSSASFFNLNLIDPPAPGDGFVVRWSAVTGRIYSVYHATNLLSGFQSLATNIVWPQAAYTDTVHSAESDGFYKVDVELAP